MAINDIVSPLQSTSYTNKDFQSIYVELLDLVKQLTYRWDPSISNESDPGVILLKLNALIADKCNYNIDKNVLECFPLSVTQQSNARQLYEQLGYYMHWYQSGTCDLSIKYIGNSDGNSYTLPAFTMVVDPDSTVSYSILGPISANPKNIGDFSISTTGKITQVRAMQGVAVNYDINGETTIRIDNLDENNRLYFPTTNIAENGIFIRNIDGADSSYMQWERRDNLLIEELGNKYFKFGLSKDQLSCYIEFPEDASYLIGSGINIVYIISNGVDGNISSNTLSKFMSSITIDDITFNEDTVYLTNTTPSVDGKDPQSINDAYNSYKKTIGTFNTLITLRDYINAIYNSGLVSNVIVSDRSNDLQDIYKIVIDDNGTYQFENKTTNEDINAFSIKLYLLEYTVSPQYYENYSKTFNVLPNDNSNLGLEYKKVIGYIEDEKAVNHDIIPFTNRADDLSSFLLIKNKYPISCTITPQYELSDNDKISLKNNILSALGTNLNSKQLNFGEAVSYDAVKDIITKSDQRIKYVSLDNINYTTYAVTYETIEGVGVFLETQINNLTSFEPIQINNNSNVSWITNGQNIFIKETGYKSGKWEFTYNSGWKVSFNGGSAISATLADYGLQISSGTNPFTIEIPLTTLIRSEVFAKSVLAGNSYIYVPNNTYALSYDKQPFTAAVSHVESANVTVTNINISTYKNSGLTNAKFNGTYSSPSWTWKLNGAEVNLETYGITASANESLNTNAYICTSLQETTVNQIDAIETNVDIAFTNSNNQYTLRENESLNFFMPVMRDLTTYANGVKFEYFTSRNLKNDTIYELEGSEYIVFYWYESNAVLYSYQIYTAGTKINKIFTTFNLSANNDNLPISDSIIRSKIDSGNYSGFVKDDTWISNIESLSSSNKLSSNKTIATKVENTVKLNNTYLWYWVTDNFNDSGRYVLFEKNGPDSIILGMNEYFIYSTGNFSEYVILGAGTSIKRGSDLHNQEMSVPFISAYDINTYGAAVITDKGYWYNQNPDNQAPSSENSYIETTEMEFISIPENSTVTISPKDNELTTWSLSFNHNKCISGDSSSYSIKDFNIVYNSQNSLESSRINIPAIYNENDVFAQSLFNINLSSTTTFKLLGNQSILYHIHGYSSDVLFTLQGANKNGSIYPICLSSSFNINFDGENRISTLLLNDDLTYNYLDLFLYSCSDNPVLDNSSTISGIVFNSNKELEIPITDSFSGNEAAVIETLLLAGNYIFEVDCPEDAFSFELSAGSAFNDTDEVKFNISDTFISGTTSVSILPAIDGTIQALDENNTVVSDGTWTIDNATGIVTADTYKTNYSASDVKFIVYRTTKVLKTELTTLTQSNKYYFVYNQSSNGLAYIKFEVISDPEKNFTITIRNPYKYNNPNINETELAFIKGKIKQLNTGSHQYACTYKIPDNQLIQDPLNAKSFFNKYHFCNKYTIPQMSAENIYISQER